MMNYKDLAQAQQAIIDEQDRQIVELRDKVRFLQGTLLGVHHALVRYGRDQALFFLDEQAGPADIWEKITEFEQDEGKGE